MTSPYAPLRRLLSWWWMVPAMVILAVCITGCTKEGPAGPPGPPGENNLIDPAIQPVVISTFPGNGSSGPYPLFSRGPNSTYPNFVIQFNKLMDMDRITHSPVFPLRITGFDKPVILRLNYDYRPIINSLKKTVNGPFDDVLAFDILDSLGYSRSSYHIGQTYTVTIDTSLYDINGNHILQPYQFAFSAEPYFRVTGSSPADGAKNVSLGSHVILYFNSSVSSDIVQHLGISPEVSGVWKWADSASVSFTPFPGAFSYNTSYTVNVDANASDAAGNTIHAPFNSSFTTPPFMVSYYYPIPTDPVQYNQSLYFQFSGPADTASIRRAFSITPAANVSLAITGTTLTVTPVPGWIPSSQYTVQLSTELTSTAGPHLAAPFVYTFTTDRFRISSTSPYDGATDISVNTSIYITLSAPVDTGSVRSAFTISPNVAGRFEFSDWQFTWIPVPSLRSSTTYQVTIGTGLKSASGVALGTPYQFSFRTQ